MTLKSITMGMAAAAAIGAAVTGVTVVTSAAGASYQVQPVVFGAPLPSGPGTGPGHRRSDGRRADRLAQQPR